MADGTHGADHPAPGPGSLPERLLPRGSARRAAARVGAQVARDARTYREHLKQLWRAAQDQPDTIAYADWLTDHRAGADDLAAQRARAAHDPLPVTFTVVVVDDPAPPSGTTAPGAAARRATLASLDAQTHRRWSTDPLPADPGPDHLVVFLEAGDRLEPDALHVLAAHAWDDPTLDLLTWDDDVLVDGAPDGTGVDDPPPATADPRFRAAWSPDEALSADPVGRAFAVRHRVLAAAPGGPTPTDGLGDARWWDLLLRLHPDPARTRHVPRVLGHLHRRPRPRATAATVFVQQHLDRLGRAGTATADGGAVRVHWDLDTPPPVSVLIPTRHNRALLGPCLASLARTAYPTFEVVVVDNGERTAANEAWYDEQRQALGHPLTVHWWTEPFNYSAVNNAAARRARGEVLVLLNDDTEATDPAWLHELVGWTQQPGVGLVGCHLTAPDGTLQHAGVVVGLGGFADHVFEGLAPATDTLVGPTRRYRNFLAVTGACAAITRERWDELGGLDERFVLCGSDVKLGLDVVQSGRRVVCTPFAGVAHKESATRGTEVPRSDFFTSWWPYQRWLRAGDPHYSPNLSRWSRVPALRPPGERDPLDLVGAIIDRPLAPRRGTAVWDDAAHAAWLVQRCSADDATVTAVADLHRANAEPFAPRTVAWWMPDLESPFYGGINTALRLADQLRRDHGVENRFVIAADPNEGFVRSAIAAAFPALADAPITFIDDPADVDRAPVVDVAVATLWETAYLLAHAPGARRKAYLVQDYEPAFYPAGTRSALAEESYRLGLYGIANTDHVLDLVRDRFAMTATGFTPAVDPSVFHAIGRRPLDHTDPSAASADGDPVTVFVYARPGHARNCWELAEAALHELKARFGTGVRIITAGSWATADDLGGGIEHLGFLDYADTGRLYRTCDVGLSLQVSEHPSYLPLELLACGVPVVAFDHPAGDWLLRHEHNSLRTRRTRDGLVDALARLTGDPALRVRLGANGAADVVERFADWDRSLADVYGFLSDPEGR